MPSIPSPATDHDLVVVESDGDLDMTRAPDFAIDLGLALCKKPRAVIADLTSVRLLSAAGLTALDRAHHHAEAVGSRLVVVAAHRGTLLPLALSGLDGVLTTFPDLPAAHAALTGLVGAGSAS